MTETIQASRLSLFLLIQAFVVTLALNWTGNEWWWWWWWWWSCNSLANGLIRWRSDMGKNKEWPVLYLLCLALVWSLVLMVDPTEVGYNHRNRKCDDKNAAKRTNSAHDLPDHRLRNHIAVPAADKRACSKRKRSWPSDWLVSFFSDGAKRSERFALSCFFRIKTIGIR